MRYFVAYISLLQAQWDKIYDGSRDNTYIDERHIEWLREVVPADRLVLFDVKDGWGPLCQTLGKEVPKVIPFPRINDSKAIDRVAEYHKKRVGALDDRVYCGWGSECLVVYEGLNGMILAQSQAVSTQGVKGYNRHIK
ncbi:hypothetical protein BDV33DRAFT_209978 [Aspergillus novoparasiticus]|uniref:Uncharacterized protein n=1 Tax=Aspergillus novoparasiticus TaxID=986946 RepID=A0A5N6E7X2_9EURO|nr:hypothetical protein BDV33DRAFT_209978 [Aspergillus novoparasiticus]